ncbi:hypothetical protein WA026_005564 [Henosepilachna vigintioctopunctata]|uniref:Carboxylesterase type B domain-containing protein n=1 Tax=Henosepilachna vigintioctopunctata TaxID=420089 RepID=A0AAW1U5V9_9CUCU
MRSSLYHSLNHQLEPSDSRTQSQSTTGLAFWKRRKCRKCARNHFLSDDDMSEDCLFLNIFMPSARTTELLPVIFWIHGGFFVSGSGKISNNRPDLLINEGVILVSINYRLGIFGYLSAEDDILPGAVNVGLLLQTPLAKGLFSAAILESGNSLNLWARSKNSKSLTKQVASVLKIEYNNTQELVDELQKIKWTDLNLISFTDFIVDAVLENPSNGFALGPTTETGPNSVVNENIHEKLRTGDFNRVPVLTGFNSGEANLVIVFYDYARFYFWTFDWLPKKLVPVDMNADSQLLNIIGKEVQNFYFGLNSITASKQLFINFLNDNEFVRPANEFVRVLSKHTDTYFYRFSYVGQLPNVEKVQRELPGAVHTEELKYLFHSPSENPASASDLVTRQRMVKLWTNFAKYHNPTPTFDPLFQNIKWKPVNGDEINFLNIDTDLQMLTNPSERNMTFWKTIYDNYGYPPYDTY